MTQERMKQREDRGWLLHLDGRGLQQTESAPGFQAEPRFTGRQVTVGHWGGWLSARTSKVRGFKASHPQFTFSCRHDRSPQWDRPVLRLKPRLNAFTVLALEVRISRVPEFKHNTLCKWYHMFTKAEVELHCLREGEDWDSVLMESSYRWHHGYSRVQRGAGGVWADC